MARRPAHVVAKIAVKVPCGQLGIWRVIRDLKTFEPTALRSLVAADPSTIADYCRRLALAGYLTRDEAGTYTLVKDQPDAPRLRRDGTPAAEFGLGQEQMWRSMKMLAEFSPRDLAVAASTDEVKVAVSTATTYIKHLRIAGYLMVVAASRPSRGKPGGGAQAVYRLKPNMNTGPLAPQIQTTDYVFDPNTGKVMGAS